MDGKIEKCDCVKSCVKLGKSATEIPEMLREAFESGQRFLNGIHISRLVGCQLKMIDVQGDQESEKRQKMFKKFENSSTKTIAKQSMSSQTPLDQLWSLPADLNREFEHVPYCSFIMTMHPPTYPRKSQSL
jgi:hypothetical protein